MEIIPGVHKIEGVSGANCYLVTSRTEMVLIDTGMRGSSKKVASYLKTLGKIPPILNTSLSPMQTLIILAAPWK